MAAAGPSSWWARFSREVAVVQDNPLAWLMKGPGRERPGEPGWSDTQRHEVTGATGGERGTLKFNLVIECPPLEQAAAELFRESRDAMSPEDRAAWDAKVRARAKARATKS